jgi:hypothetical protein
VLDERHSGNKDLESVFNDVFRRCAAIGAQLSRDSAVLEFVFSQLKEETWKLGHSGCLNTPLQVSLIWMMPQLYEMRERIRI